MLLQSKVHNSSQFLVHCSDILKTPTVAAAKTPINAFPTQSSAQNILKKVNFCLSSMRIDIFQRGSIAGHKISKGKCKVVFLGLNIPTHQCMPGLDQDKQLCRKCPEVLLDTKLAVNQKFVLVAKKIKTTPGCMRKSVVSRIRRQSFPFIQRWWDLYYHAQFWAPQNKIDEDILKRVQQWGSTKMVKRLEHLSQKKRLRTFSQEKRRLKGVSHHRIKISEGKMKIVRLFSVVSRNRTTSEANKLKHGTFHLNIRKHFFLWGWLRTATSLGGCGISFVRDI